MADDQDRDKESGPARNSNDMMGSVYKFFSEWSQAGQVAGSAGRPTRDYAPVRQTPTQDTVIEMHEIGDDPPEGKKNRTHEVALIEWKCVNNIDAFLDQAYAYYYGHGFYGILFSRGSNLIILAFVLFFSLFLLYGVDWRFLAQPATAISHPRLSEVVHLWGILWMPWYSWLFSLCFCLLWVWQMIRLVKDIPNLQSMHRFYKDLLGIGDSELHACEFADVLEKIRLLQERHPLPCLGRGESAKLDAMAICNRIMRRENYLIALFNKDILGFDPAAGHPSLPGKDSPTLRPAVTKVLEWNLSFCILNFVFDERHTIRKNFLRDLGKETLREGLNRRFLLMGLINLIFSPFIFAYLLVYMVFRHGEELYRNPRTVSARQYTTNAKWRLREFNELPHYFERRLANSTKKATRYMEQFHNHQLVSIARMTSFIAGSFALVILAITLANEDLLMHFEITQGKSPIWYLAFFGAILAISRSVIPDDVKASDPQKLMTSVVEYTHYLPKHWRGHMHTELVRGEFSQMYQYRLTILLQELISVFVTPFYILFTAPKSTDRLIDFFREFTVHVDGLGYVCSFALFDFKRHGNKRYGALGVISNSDKTQRTRQGKMEKSFLSFVSNNPQWQPDAGGSQYLGKLQDFEQSVILTGTRDTNRSLADSIMARRSKGTPILEAQPVLLPEEGNEEGDNEDFQRGLISILNKYYDYSSNNL